MIFPARRLTLIFFKRRLCTTVIIPNIEDLPLINIFVLLLSYYFCGKYAADAGFTTCRPPPAHPARSSVIPAWRMHYEDVSHWQETIRAADNAYTLRLCTALALLFLTEKPRLFSTDDKKAGKTLTNAPSEDLILTS